MATKTQTRPLEKRETSNLIGNDKVEGTPGYRSNGDSVGQIERVMIDKLSGKVAYVVMSFGGFPSTPRRREPARFCVARAAARGPCVTIPCCGRAPPRVARRPLLQ